MKVNKLLLYILLTHLISLFFACETPFIDSDGDGLSDEQERLFGTDPFNADTNGDTMPDALDPMPWKDAGATLKLIPMSNEIKEDYARLSFFITLHNKGNQRLDKRIIKVSSNQGHEVFAQEIDKGVYAFECLVTQEGDLWIEAQFQPDYPEAKPIKAIWNKTILFKETDLPDDKKEPEDTEEPGEQNGNDTDPPPPFNLAIPGVNTHETEQSGPMDGTLYVMAIDNQSINWEGQPIKGVPDAYVQIDLPNGEQIITQTNKGGWIKIEDARLNSKVNITVGKSGYRYTSFMQLDARYLSVTMGLRPPLSSEKEKVGSISGTIFGFNGEGGLAVFPKENVNIFDTVNVAIVQIATRHTPLSSKNSGSILISETKEGQYLEYFSIPPNLVIANQKTPESSRFTLPNVTPGKHLIFALAGEASRIFEASKNPYQLKFKPRALAIKEVELKANQTLNVDLTLNIDLTEGTTVEIPIDAHANDPKTNAPLPNALVLPLIDTGKGFIFVDVNSAYNLENFQNPITARFPNPRAQPFLDAELRAEPIVVALSGRQPYIGFDLPGISTIVRYLNKEPSLDFSKPQSWVPIPRIISPKPAQSNDLDAVGETLQEGGLIAWQNNIHTDFTVLRFNYLTPPSYNVLLGSYIGASKAHLLWEIYVPNSVSQIALPTLNPSAPDYPVLKNYEPSLDNPNLQYDEKTVELEINTYRMGPEAFDYQRQFKLSDLNLNTDSVAQERALIRYEPAGR